MEESNSHAIDFIERMNRLYDDADSFIKSFLDDILFVHPDTPAMINIDQLDENERTRMLDSDQKIRKGIERKMKIMERQGLDYLEGEELEALHKAENTIEIGINMRRGIKRRGALSNQKVYLFDSATETRQELVGLRRRGIELMAELLEHYDAFPDVFQNIDGFPYEKLMLAGDMEATFSILACKMPRVMKSHVDVIVGGSFKPLAKHLRKLNKKVKEEEMKQLDGSWKMDARTPSHEIPEGAYKPTNGMRPYVHKPETVPANIYKELDSLILRAEFGDNTAVQHISNLCDSFRIDMIKVGEYLDSRLDDYNGRVKDFFKYHKDLNPKRAADILEKAVEEGIQCGHTETLKEYGHMMTQVARSLSSKMHMSDPPGTVTSNYIELEFKIHDKISDYLSRCG